MLLQADLHQGRGLDVETNYLPSPGEVIQKGKIKISKAVELLNALEKLPYFSLIETRKTNNSSKNEIIVFETEVEIGQRTIHDIRKTERIAVVFNPSDNSFPEVLALREDFPKVSHLNIRDQEKPRSLCLFDENYNEIKIRWTPTLLLKRIREWLRLTARGELHREDQPLEPLLMASPFHLIIPFDLFTPERKDKHDALIIRRIDFSEYRTTFIADWENNIELEKDELKYIPIHISGSPQPHGIINRVPKNLSELHGFLKAAKVDLINNLRDKLRSYCDDKLYKKNCDSQLVIIIGLPKTRTLKDLSEDSDTWAFLTKNSIKEIGIEIGLWEITDGEPGLLIFPDATKNGSDIEISFLNPVLSFSKEVAQRTSGISIKKEKKIMLIGCGALGSQVFNNLIRMGYGDWTLIDDDCLLPHNLTRHALPGNAQGFSKATALELFSNNLFQNKPVAKSIVANILKPFNSEDKLKDSYEKAEIIIDASASIAVGRHIAKDISSPARRLSIFLSPSGSDSVLIAEDAKREIPLDCLEMQYYRYLINKPALKNHLKQSNVTFRYGRSCRDFSNTIPQDFVALHSAICSRALRNTISNEDAAIIIWTADSKDFQVKKYTVPFFEIKKYIFKEWTLYCDTWLLEKIHNFRLKRLPNETGGVLIGSFDMQRKIIYVFDTILSPSDSEEWPTVYKRGCKGLRQGINEIHKSSAGMLDYVGEWHSHPQNCGVKPSKDDKIAFSWLKEIMNTDALPALMLIVGDNKESWYLNKIK